MSNTDEVLAAAPGGAEQVIADRYRVIERIGHGGMADVFRAHDESLGRDVALKIFRRELASAEDLARQEAEVRLLAGLSHPSLVTLFDATSDDEGRGVLVLEYVKGSDGRARLRSGPLPGPAVAAIGADVANALAYIHHQGVVHRDISPANILLPESPTTGIAAKLTDLGIARLVDDARITATGSVMGTASYMSPEQALGRPLTGRSDVYSLGLVLLECLTGRREFTGTLAESAAARLTRDPAIPAGLDPRWGTLLAAMTAREPEQRPEAAGAAARLRELADQDAWRGDAAATTEALTAPLEPEAVGTGSTLLLPTSEPDQPPATAPLTPHAAARAATTRPAAGARSRILGIMLAVDALVAVLAIIFAAVTLSTTGHSVPDPVTSYPPVSGTLGDHLKQLEDQVSRNWSP
ncbi:serine/threonine-protein kinase [Leifsonia sp. NPDC080035]|uniref:non-specific serine/threonine protein kinase n=1 Tax=Leifsonia sp. NPDC080035 TaxID=3143936 RepID=A0AAU7GHJ5_9MICO